MLCSLLLQKQSQKPGPKIFMIRMTEKQRSAVVSNSAKPTAAHRVMKKPSVLENWKGLLQTVGLLKALRPEKEPFIKEHMAHMEFPLPISNYSSDLHSIFSLLRCHFWYQPADLGLQIEAQSNATV